MPGLSDLLRNPRRLRQFADTPGNYSAALDYASQGGVERRPARRSYTTKKADEPNTLETGKVIEQVQLPDGSLVKPATESGKLVKVPGKSNLYLDPASGEPYQPDPTKPTGLRSAYETARQVKRDGKVYASVSGVGERELGPDPKVAEDAAKAAAKREAENRRLAMAREKRPYNIDRVTGEPVPLQTDEEWAAIKQAKAAKLDEAARVKRLKDQADLLELDAADIRETAPKPAKEDEEAFTAAESALSQFAAGQDMEEAAAKYAAAPATDEASQQAKAAAENYLAYKDKVKPAKEAEKKVQELEARARDIKRQIIDPKGWKAGKAAEITTLADDDLVAEVKAQADIINEQEGQAVGTLDFITKGRNKIVEEINAFQEERRLQSEQGLNAEEIEALNLQQARLEQSLADYDEHNAEAKAESDAALKAAADRRDVLAVAGTELEGRAAKQAEAAVQAKAKAETMAKAKPLYEQWAKGLYAEDWRAENFPRLEQEAKKAGLDVEQAKEALQTYRQLDWSNPRRDPQTAKPIAEESRTLPDGNVTVNPTMWGDAEAYKKAVEASQGTPEGKAKALEAFPKLQEIHAERAVEILSQSANIPGADNFMAWRERKIAKDQAQQGKLGFARQSPAKQAIAYMDEMKNRSWFRKAGEQVAMGLLAGFQDIATQALGVGGMVTGSEILADLAAANAENTQNVVGAQSLEGSDTDYALRVMGMGARMTPAVAAMISGAGAVGGGLTTASILAGGQTAGSMFADLYRTAKDEAGLSHGEAWKKAALPAALAGTITGLLTKGMGATGLERVFSDTATQEVARNTFKAMLGQFVKGAAEELPEEIADEYFTTVLQESAASADPVATFKNFANTLPELAGVTALMGGAGALMQARRQASGQEPGMAPPPEGEAPAMPVQPRPAGPAPTPAPETPQDVTEQIAKFNPTGATPLPQSVAATAKRTGRPPAAVARQAASGVVKIAQGQSLESLDIEEQEALGFVNKGGKITPDTKVTPLVYLYKDKPVLRNAAAEWLIDEAQEGLADMVKLTEAERKAQIDAEEAAAKAKPAGPEVKTSDSLSENEGSTPSPATILDAEMDRAHAEWQAGKKEVDDAFNATEPHSQERKEAREKRNQWTEKNGATPPPSSRDPLSDLGALSNKDSDTKFSLAGTGWRLTGAKETSIRGKPILYITNGKTGAWVEESDLTDQHRQILGRSNEPTTANEPETVQLPIEQPQGQMPEIVPVAAEQPTAPPQKAPPEPAPAASQPEPTSLSPALTPAQADQMARAKAEYDSAMRAANANPEPEIREKKKKEAGMRFSAAKRIITGKLTAKEAEAKAKREASNYEGKAVSVDGKNAEVIGNAFGKVKVKFADGTKAAVPAAKVKPPVEAEASQEAGQAEGKPAFREYPTDKAYDEGSPYHNALLRSTVTEDMVKSAQRTADAQELPAYIGGRKESATMASSGPYVTTKKADISYVLATVYPDGKVELEKNVFRIKPSTAGRAQAEPVPESQTPPPQKPATEPETAGQSSAQAVKEVAQPARPATPEGRAEAALAEYEAEVRKVLVGQPDKAARDLAGRKLILAGRLLARLKTMSGAVDYDVYKPEVRAEKGELAIEVAPGGRSGILFVNPGKLIERLAKDYPDKNEARDVMDKWILHEFVHLGALAKMNASKIERLYNALTPEAKEASRKLYFKGARDKETGAEIQFADNFQAAHEWFAQQVEALMRGEIANSADIKGISDPTLRESMMALLRDFVAQLREIANLVQGKNAKIAAEIRAEADAVQAAAEAMAAKAGLAVGGQEARVADLAAKVQAVEAAQPAPETQRDAIDEELAKAFGGLSMPPVQQAVEQIALPKDRREAMLKAAGNIVDLGLTDPADLVARLDRLAPGGALRKYARSFWRLMTGFNAELTESPDWQTVFAAVDSAKASPPAEAAPETSADPNIGREWDSIYGRQRIVSRDDRGLGSYLAQTVGTDTVRHYSIQTIDDEIRRQEYALTPEYAAEQEERKARAERQAQAEKAQEEAKAKAAEQVNAYFDDIGLNPMQRGKLKAALDQFAARRRGDTGKEYSGPRYTVTEQMVADGFLPQTKQVPAMKEPSGRQWNRMDNRQQQEFERKRKAAGMKTEYRLTLPDGSMFEVTKAEHDYAKWLAAKAGLRVKAEEAGQQFQQSPDFSGLVAGADTTPSQEPLKVTTPTVEKHLRSFDYLTSNKRDFDIQALGLSREDVADAAVFIPDHFNAGSAASYGWMYGWKEGRKGQRNPGDRNMGGGIQNSIIQGNQAYDQKFGIIQKSTEPDYIDKGMGPKRLTKSVTQAVSSQPAAEQADPTLWADVSRFFASMNSDSTRAAAIKDLKNGTATEDSNGYLIDLLENPNWTGNARSIAPKLIARLKATMAQPAAQAQAARPAPPVTAQTRPAATPSPEATTYETQQKPVKSQSRSNAESTSSPNVAGAGREFQLKPATLQSNGNNSETSAFGTAAQDDEDIQPQLLDLTPAQERILAQLPKAEAAEALKKGLGYDRPQTTTHRLPNDPLVYLDRQGEKKLGYIDQDGRPHMLTVEESASKRQEIERFESDQKKRLEKRMETLRENARILDEQRIYQITPSGPAYYKKDGKWYKRGSDRQLGRKKGDDLALQTLESANAGLYEVKVVSDGDTMYYQNVRQPSPEAQAPAEAPASQEPAQAAGPASIGQENVNAKHSREWAEVSTEPTMSNPKGSLKTDAIRSKTPSAPWYYQGDIRQLAFNQKVIEGGKSAATPEGAQTLKEYSAAVKDGWSYTSVRAGSYGTVYVFRKGKQVLTNAGAAALTSEAMARPEGVPEGRGGNETNAVSRLAQYSAKLMEWLQTLPESTLNSPAALSTKMRNDVLAKWVRLREPDHKPYEWQLQYLKPDGTTDVQFFAPSLEELIKAAINYAVIERDMPAAERDRGYGYPEFKDAPTVAETLAANGFAKAASQPAQPSAPEAGQGGQVQPITNFDSARAFIGQLREGQVTAEQVRTAWAQLKAARPAILADLNKMKVDDLLPMAGISARKSDGKAFIAKSALNSLDFYFTPDGTVSYTFGGNTDANKDAAMDEKVAKWTDEMIAEQARARSEAAEARKAAREKALTNPETLDEWNRFVFAKGRQALTAEEVQKIKKMKSGRNEAVIRKGETLLTPDQLAAYDAVRGITRKEEAQARTEAQARVYGVASGVEADIIETKHTQKGHDLFVVKLSERVPTPVYNSLNTAAKKLGGYYSKYNKGGAVPGFQFKTRAAAENFIAVSKGETVDQKEQIQERQEAKKSAAAARLTDLANGLDIKADGILNADRKTNTAKRAREAAGQEATARKMKAMAQTMRNLAAAMESGEATHLDGVRMGTHVETLDSMARGAMIYWIRDRKMGMMEREKTEADGPTAEMMDATRIPYPYLDKSTLMDLVAKGRETPGAKLLAERVAKIRMNENDGQAVTLRSDSEMDDVKELAQKVTERGKPVWDTIKWKFETYDRLKAMGLTNLPSLRAALREFLQYRGQAAKADPIKAMERELIGMKLPGFFPTPRPIIDEMIGMAGIEPGMKVLEPSAGKGDIAEAAQEAGAEVDAIELSTRLQDILKAKGINVIDNDFTSREPVAEYDAVVMNPPFENGQDMEHVQHAYKFLKPGGKLVAIMSAGPFFRQDKQATAFREWLDEQNSTYEAMPEGSFAGADAFRQTGVRTQMVTITKPAQPALALPPGQPAVTAGRESLTLSDAISQIENYTENELDTDYWPEDLRDIAQERLDHLEEDYIVAQDWYPQAVKKLVADYEKSEVPADLAREAWWAAGNDGPIPGPEVELNKKLLDELEEWAASDEARAAALAEYLPAVKDRVADTIRQIEATGRYKWNKKTHIFDETDPDDTKVLYMPPAPEGGPAAQAEPGQTDADMEAFIAEQQAIAEEEAAAREALRNDPDAIDAVQASGKMSGRNLSKQFEYPEARAVYQALTAARDILGGPETVQLDKLHKWAKETFESDPAKYVEWAADMAEEKKLLDVDEQAVLGQAFQFLTREARLTGDKNTRALLNKVGNYYLDTGTRLAQAMSARRDPLETPQERWTKALDIVFGPSEAVRRKLRILPTEAGKARRIASLEAQLAEVQGSRRADIEAALKTARAQETQEELLEKDDAESQKIKERVLKNIGVTEDDLMLSGTDRVALQSAILDLPAVKAGLEAYKGKDNDGYNIMRLAFRGFSDAHIANYLNLNQDDVGQFIQAATNAIIRPAVAEQVKAGTGFGGLVKAGFARLKKAVGLGLPPEAIEDQPSLIKGTRQTVDDVTAEVNRVMKYALQSAKARNSGKLMSKVVMTPGGQRVRVFVPFDPDDMANYYAFAREYTAAKAGKFDKLYEYWINWPLLSGPQTQVANITGNAAQVAWHYTGQRFTEAFFNLFYQDPNAPQYREFKHILKGFWQGIGPAFEMARQTFLTEGDTIRHKYLGEDMQIDMVDGDLDKVGNIRASVGGKLGRINRLPGRVLRFTDAFFKTAIMYAEASAVAYRRAHVEAKSQGLKGNARANFIDTEIANTLNDPSSAVWGEVMKTAEELLFQDENMATAVVETLLGGGKGVKGIERLLADAEASGNYKMVNVYGKILKAVKLVGNTLRLIFPFQRTPTNILRAGIKKAGGSAISLLYGLTMAGWRKHKDGTDFIKSYPKAMQIKDASETLLAGIGWLALASMMEGDDNDDEKPVLLVGSRPHGRSERQFTNQFMEKYGGENSVVWQDGKGNVIKSRSFGRYEPIGTTLTTWIDAYRNFQEVKRLKSQGENASYTTYMLSSLASTLEDKSFLQGFANMMQFWRDVEERKENPDENAWTKFLLTNVMPNLIKQPLRQMDDVIRERTTAAPGYAALPNPEIAPKLPAFAAQAKIGTTGQKLVKDDLGYKPLRILFPANVQVTPRPDSLVYRANKLHPTKRWAPATLNRDDYTADPPGKAPPVPITDPAKRRQFAELVGKKYSLKAAAIAARLTATEKKNPPVSYIEANRKAMEAARAEARRESWVMGLHKATATP